MEGHRIEVPATIPEWRDQHLYELLYPRASLFSDIQGQGPMDRQTVINLYQDHLARAIDVSDLLTAGVIFWTSTPIPTDYRQRRGYPVWTGWERIDSNLEPFQTYVVDDRCHITRLPCDAYRFQNRYVSRSIVLCIDQQLQNVKFGSTTGYQHHLGIVDRTLYLHQPTRALHIGPNLEMQPYKDNLERFFKTGSQPVRFDERFQADQ